MGEYFPMFVAFATAGFLAILVYELAGWLVRRDLRVRHNLARRMALPLPLEKTSWFRAARYGIVFTVVACVSLGLLYYELHMMGAGILGAIAAIGLRLAAQTEQWI